MCLYLFRSKTFPRGEQTCRLSDRERSPLERRRQHVLSTFTRYKNKRHHTLLFGGIRFFSLLKFSSKISSPSLLLRQRRITQLSPLIAEKYYVQRISPISSTIVSSMFHVCVTISTEKRWQVVSRLEERSKHECWKFGIYHSLGGQPSYTLESTTKLKRSADNKSDIVILRLRLSFNPSWALTRSCRATGLSNLLL